MIYKASTPLDDRWLAAERKKNLQPVDSGAYLSLSQEWALAGFFELAGQGLAIDAENCGGLAAMTVD